jgi:15-cis-phytoene synthase
MSAASLARVERGAAGAYQHPAPAVQLVDQKLAAAPDGPASLETCYEICRQLHAAHGRTYYLATRLLPAGRRRHVHALYGFARYADDLVDHFALSWGPEQRRAALESWSREALTAILRGTSVDPVLNALAHTVAELGIRLADLRAFLDSMAMDLTVTRYPTYEDLYEYMHGSAAVIGAMMVPALGAPANARERAMDLGVAFQLSNFLRDVAEDWDRGRIYLPLEDLERFGVGEWDFHARHVGPGFRRLLAYEIARTRALYRRAEEGWALLPPASRRCIRVAHRLYAGILDAIEAGEYQVFRFRANVPARQKVAVAARELIRPRARSRDPAGRVRQNGRRLEEVQTWSGEVRSINARRPVRSVGQGNGPAPGSEVRKARSVQPFTNSRSEIADGPATNGKGPATKAPVIAPRALEADEHVELAGLTPVLMRRNIELVTERRFDVVDVTEDCLELLAASRVREGTLTVYSQHTTCAVKINERETCFLEDLRLFMEALVPASAYYRHDDFEIRDPETLAGGPEDEPVNGHSHIKQMLLGSASESVPVVDGALALGRWQRIMFIELDQSRPRSIRIQVQGWR